MTGPTTSGTQGPPPALPAGLREALRRDSRPVRPLLPPIVRTLLVAAVALAAILLALGVAGLRPDFPSLGPLLLWVPTLARLAAGAALILLAFREGVPGSGGSAPLRAVALLGAPVLLALLAEWVAAATAGEMPPLAASLGARSPVSCFPVGVVLALPAVFLLGFLLARAYPLRPVFAATAGALGAGLVADAGLHLTCPVTAASHTLLVHGGAVAAVAAAAAAIGWAGGRLRLRRGLLL